MRRYYRTPEGLILFVDRDSVNESGTEGAVHVSIAFGRHLFTTEARVQEDFSPAAQARHNNAMDAFVDGDDEVVEGLLWEEEEKYGPLFEEAEAWVMRNYPGSVRSYEDEDLLD